MTRPAKQELFHGPGEHLILYDGVCGLCNRLNRFVLSQDKPALFDFASLQSGLGRSILRHFGKDPDDLSTFYLVRDYHSASPELLSKSRAALAILQSLGFPWRWLAVLKVLPKTLLDWGYDLIAKHRYGLGQAERCALPASEHRHRFIDHEYQREPFLKVLSDGILPSDIELASHRCVIWRKET